MPAKVLTAAAIARLKPARKRLEVPDGKTGGLYLVIQPSGTKSWALRFRRPSGQKAKLTIGPLDYSGRELRDDPTIGQPLTLSAARWLAADIMRQRQRGIDVIAEHAASKDRRRIETAEADANTFGSLVRQFADEHLRRNVRRWREAARTLGLAYPLDGGEPVVVKDGLAQRWADKPVSRIDGHDIHAVIEEATRYGVPGRVRRNRELSNPRGRSTARALSRFFSWVVKQQRKLSVNPTVGVYVPKPPASRERVLSESEIRWFWHACHRVGFPFGPLCQLLLLTAARREEVRVMTHAELSPDRSLWSLSGARVKNRRPHEVPLSPLARDVIDALPRIESKTGFLFTTNGETAIGGFSKYKARLDRVMLDIARAECGRDIAIPAWVLHDLRRSTASGLQKLKVRVEVIERCLNHTSGSFANVVGVYQRDPMIEERTEALQRWAAHIQGIVTGSPSNVVTLPRKGA